MSVAQDALLPVASSGLQVPLADGSTGIFTNLDYAAGPPALRSVAAAVSAAAERRLDASDLDTARSTVAAFIGARADDSVVFTRNATDALSLLASVVPGESIVLDIEHRANLAPWIGRGTRVLPAGRSVEELLRLLDYELQTRPAAVVAVSGANNVTGERLPLARFAAVAHRHGGRLAVDGAQLVAHRRVDISGDGIDYLAFSGTKLYAPFGSGVLVGRTDWLDAGRQGSLAGAARYETGSPNVIGALALAEAVTALSGLDPELWREHERELRTRLVLGLREIPGVVVHRVFDDSVDALGIVSFAITGVSAASASIALLEEWGIAVGTAGAGAGTFGSDALVERLGGQSVRASVGVGSTAADAERLLDAVAILAARPNIGSAP